MGRFRRDQRTPIVVPLPPLPRAPGRLVHGDCPPEGAVTLAMATELEGFRARSINSVRAHLDRVRLSDRWVGPGDRKPRALYSRSEVERIAGELERRRPNPYKPPMYSPYGASTATSRRRRTATFTPGGSRPRSYKTRSTTSTTTSPRGRCARSSSTAAGPAARAHG